MRKPNLIINPAEPINWAHPLNSGLVSRWQNLPYGLAGGGVTARDLVRKSGNHGTLTNMLPSTSTSGWGPTARPGGYGEWRCDGTAGYIDVVDGFTNTIKNNNFHAILFWINPTSLANQPVIFEAYNTVDVLGMFLELKSDGGFYWSYANTYRTYSASGMTINKWYHVAAVKTGSGDSGNLYLDGVLVTSYAGSFGSTPNENSNLYIGRYRSAGYYLNGAIDNIAIYNRALSATEVFAAYSGSKTYDDPSLNWMVRRAYSFPTGAAGITFDAASNGGYTAASNTDTWSHTNAGNYLIVGVPMLGVANVSSITFNGVALTSLGSRTSAGTLLRIELWGLVAPLVGTANIVVTLDGSIAWAGVASSWSGVHQTSPTEGFNSATATNVGAADATVDITSVADNCVIVDVMASSDGAVTVGAGQTSRNNVTGAAGSGTMSSEGPKTPAGAVTMSWTDIGAAMTWVTGGIALRPLAAADLTTGQPFAKRLGGVRWAASNYQRGQRVRGW